jgi:multimeric flavodoxin WrbA
MSDETTDARTQPRAGMPSAQLDEHAFRKRFLAQFRDDAFAPLQSELDQIAAAAWDAYDGGRKSPHNQRAGEGYADPDYELSVDWLAAKAALAQAQRRHEDASAPGRILLVNCSSRSDQTCPGEISKSWRLAGVAQAAIEAIGGFEVEVLDLSRLASEYGRNIHPCKACFSTAAALCHWPCSCYPNYSLGQSQDWMNEIYPQWVAAHGVMLVTPVNWYQVSSPLKLMMDRLVCADGGNADPTSTHGKTPAEAKALELAGWDYPQHLSGRLFSVVVHGDAEGAENVRRSLSDWLRATGLESAGALAEIDRYIGYWEPYATSHLALDADEAVQAEVRNAATILARAIVAKRAGRWSDAEHGVEEPRQK